MNTELLAREPLGLDEFSDFGDGDFLDDLGKDANTLLSYDGLNIAHRQAQDHRLLAQVFDKLDIRPFTSASVETYKDACEWSVKPRLIQSAIATFLIATIVGLVAVCVLTISAMVAAATVAFYSALAVLISTVAGITSCVIWVQYDRERKWIMQELSTYKEPIPEYALQTAVDIKQLYPEAEFRVCTLTERKIVVDPFLVLRTRHGRDIRDYYLEVWNESEFKGEREA